MPVSPSFRDFVAEQFAASVPSLRHRAMFGGVGLYAGDLFFALIDDDLVYLKVDAENRGDFEAAGKGPFMPFGPGGEVMQYYELPGEVLEDREELARWAARAIEVARRARLGKGRKARGAAKPPPPGRKPRRKR